MGNTSCKCCGSEQPFEVRDMPEVGMSMDEAVLGFHNPLNSTHVTHVRDAPPLGKSMDDAVLEFQRTSSVSSGNGTAAQKTLNPSHMPEVPPVVPPVGKCMDDAILGMQKTLSISSGNGNAPQKTSTPAAPAVSWEEEESCEESCEEPEGTIHPDEKRFFAFGPAESEKMRRAAYESPTSGRRRVSTKDGVVDPEFLATVPVFKRCLDKDEIKTMADNMHMVTFDEGGLFIKQGDLATDFFVILSGVVSVFITNGEEETKEVATLSDGDVFGEAALVRDGRRNASLKAQTKVVCFCISNQKVKDLGLDSHLTMVRRAAVGRECIMERGHSKEMLSESPTNKDSLKDQPTETEEEALVNKALQSNVNLKHLLPSSGNVAKEIVQYCKQLDVEKGTVLISQGDTEADSFYIIEEGSFAVTVVETVPKRSLMLRRISQVSSMCDKCVGTLRAGQSFGELALLYRAPRAATVRALEDSKVWVLDRMAFKDILRNIALAKNKEYVKYLNGLNLLSSLSSAEKRLLTSAFESVHLTKDNVIFQPGDSSNTLYILIDGDVEVVEEKKRPKVLKADFSKNKWRYFGQEALLSTRPRGCKVTVISKTARALTLERDAFSMLLRGSSDSSGSDWFKYMGPVSQLRAVSSVPDDVKEAMARAVTKETYHKNDLIYNKGDEAEFFYIVTSGMLENLDGTRCVLIEGAPNAGIVDHFGDREIFESKKRLSTVKVVSDSAIVLRIPQDHFVKLMSPFKEHFSRFWAGVEQIVKNDLTMLGVIARGQFGPVELCRHNHTGHVYVLKTMRKDLIVKSEAKKSVMRERAVWIQLKSPFVVQLCGLYNEPQSLHYLLEFVSAGSLAEVYHLQGFWGSNAHARFYVAAVVCALRHIQKKRLIHRDIKPENILICRTGHPKLYDFAFAKPLIGKTFTTCGTPQYMAPEVLIGTGHTKAVDWWGLGILLFELMTGESPFVADEVMQIYSKVIRGIAKVEFPPSCEGDVTDLIKKLCTQDASARLVGAVNVMAHPYYKDFDWRGIATQTMPPPYRPLESTALTLPHETARNHDLPLWPLYKDDGSGWDRGFAMDLGLSNGGTGSSSTLGFSKVPSIVANPHG